MGKRGDHRKLPPLPWTWATEREHFVYLFDAAGGGGGRRQRQNYR